ncbi:uncharacterized protein LOC111342397 [Stylophora pistillata]|uniref:uncharacterized protein LOC111342397 n=1 Tax=Stylophora pistillata TaxID=50429 RepID=UPI000C0490DD|nr:uncharacterized protein LOC111342397 [Stylophora pistillata]
MVNPHWPYLPKRQENYETEEEREAIEGVWNTISEDPLNYQFFYHILDGDEGGRPPKIVALDGYKEMENTFFNQKDKLCLHAIARSNNKEALQHPVVRMLIRSKWRSYGHLFLKITRILEILLESEINSGNRYESFRDEDDEGNRTLMHYAAELGFLQVIKTLVRKCPELLVVKTEEQFKPVERRAMLPVELAIVTENDDVAAFLVRVMWYER